MAIKYKDLTPVGRQIIVGAACFGLGAIYGNLPFDLATLWKPSPEAFERLLAHYRAWGNSPMWVHHVLHGVMGLGLVGCFIKLYKPDNDALYFEYGTLALMMLLIVVYLTNLRVGVNLCLLGDWGEVDQGTGINVMAASQTMVVIVLLGVLFLQGGLYYAELEDRRLKEEFFKKYPEELNRDAKPAAATEAAEATEEVKEVKETKASGAKKTKAKKRA